MVSDGWLIHRTFVGKVRLLKGQAWWVILENCNQYIFNDSWNHVHSSMWGACSFHSGDSWGKWQIPRNHHRVTIESPSNHHWINIKSPSNPWAHSFVELIQPWRLCGFSVDILWSNMALGYGLQVHRFSTNHYQSVQSFKTAWWFGTFGWSRKTWE